jgi:hypothetical protein
MENKEEIVISLVEHGADPNAIIECTTPLAAAVLAGHPHCVFTLLALGANPDKPYTPVKDGATPIELACQCELLALRDQTRDAEDNQARQIIAYLCVFGAVQGPTANPFTPEHWCSWIQASFEYTRFELALAVCDENEMEFLLRTDKLPVYGSILQRPRWNVDLSRLAAKTSTHAGIGVAAFIDLAVKWSPASHHLHPKAKNLVHALLLIAHRHRLTKLALPSELWIIIGGFCGRVSL